jgi:hypothetical protein
MQSRPPRSKGASRKRMVSDDASTETWERERKGEERDSEMEREKKHPACSAGEREHTLC